MKIFGFLLCCTVALATDVISTRPVVQSPAGLYQGSIIRSQSLKYIFAFRGIRYADAPIGKNRFKQATAAEPHDGIFDATKDAPICPQVDAGSREMSEDCLRLNVYTPALPTGSNQPDRPVLVFLHPGGITGPFETSYELRPNFVLDEDVVFVMLNYRTGALGFLSTGEEHAPGNAGLKDQVLGLRWIQQNIQSFGGDPNKVTLYGHSTSSIFVSLHLVSPMSKGLFHRALTSSGAATSQSPLPSNQKDLAKRQAELLGCPVDTFDNMFDCLYEESPRQYLDSYTKLSESNEYPQLIWTPVVEQTRIDGDADQFLTGQPEDLIRHGNATFVPLFIGVNTDEQGHFVIKKEETAQRGDSHLYDAMNNNWEELAPKLFEYESGTTRSSHISRELRSFYLNDEPLKAGRYHGLARLYADALTIFRVHRLERLMATYSHEPIYYYLNNYKNCDTLAGWSNGSRFGVVHHDEMPLLYNIDGRPAHCDEDWSTANLVWKLVVNFANTGDPTPENKAKEFPVRWTTSTKDQPRYLDFNGDDMKMVNGSIYQERMEKWDELFPLSSDIK